MTARECRRGGRRSRDHLFPGSVSKARRSLKRYHRNCRPRLSSCRAQRNDRVWGTIGTPTTITTRCKLWKRTRQIPITRRCLFRLLVSYIHGALERASTRSRVTANNRDGGALRASRLISKYRLLRWNRTQTCTHNGTGEGRQLNTLLSRGSTPGRSGTFRNIVTFGLLERGRRGSIHSNNISINTRGRFKTSTVASTSHVRSRGIIGPCILPCVRLSRFMWDSLGRPAIDTAHTRTRWYSLVASHGAAQIRPWWKLTEHLDTLHRAERVEIPVKRTVEAHPALPPPGPPRQHAQQHAEREHKGAHDYADRPQDAGIAGEGDPRGVRVLVLVLARTTVRRSCNGEKEGEKDRRCLFVPSVPSSRVPYITAKSWTLSDLAWCQ